MSDTVVMFRILGCSDDLNGNFSADFSLADGRKGIFAYDNVWDAFREASLRLAKVFGHELSSAPPTIVAFLGNHSSSQLINLGKVDVLVAGASLTPWNSDVCNKGVLLCPVTEGQSDKWTFEILGYSLLGRTNGLAQNVLKTFFSRDYMAGITPKGADVLKRWAPILQQLVASFAPSESEASWGGLQWISANGLCHLSHGSGGSWPLYGIVKEEHLCRDWTGQGFRSTALRLGDLSEGAEHQELLFYLRGAITRTGPATVDHVVLDLGCGFGERIRKFAECCRSKRGLFVGVERGRPTAAAGGFCSFVQTLSLKTAGSVAVVLHGDIRFHTKLLMSVLKSLQVVGELRHPSRDPAPIDVLISICQLRWRRRKNSLFAERWALNCPKGLGLFSSSC